MSNISIEKRFGIIAVEERFISLDQLIEAIKIQVNEDLKGLEHRLVGEILVEKEFITPAQVKKVLTIMGVPI